MSLNVTAVSAATPLLAVGRTAPARPAQDAGSDAVIVDLSPSSPPPEARDAIAVAGQSSAQLAAADCDLRFNINERTGKVSVAVHDLRGSVLFTVPSSKALDIAAGGTL
ncbi:MAG: hypothetical protein ACLP22_12280 [Solirubrobacteraceae bacterium]